MAETHREMVRRLYAERKAEAERKAWELMKQILDRIMGRRSDITDRTDESK